MKKILICEIFGSTTGESGKIEGVLQAEGKFNGAQSIFIRSFGCNLRCAFDDFERNSTKELLTKVDSIKSLDDFPQLKTECDSLYSVLPQFSKLSSWVTVDELFENIKNRINPNKQIPHLVITGGESMLPKWLDFYAELIPLLIYKLNIEHITFETNGTQKLTEEFKKSIVDFSDYIHFSISPKLSNSGHSIQETLKTTFVKEYCLYSNDSWFKFVINKESDLIEINSFLNAYNTNIPVYLMPMGGTKKEYLGNESLVYDICSRYGFNFSSRAQVTCCDNKIGK